MRWSLQTTLVLYTVALSAGVALAVGWVTVGLTRERLEESYRRGYEAIARQVAYQLVDPLYKLDAFGVELIVEETLRSDPSVHSITVVDRTGRSLTDLGVTIGTTLNNAKSVDTAGLRAVMEIKTWSARSEDDLWVVAGPAVDIEGEVQGAVRFEFDRGPLRAVLLTTTRRTAAVVLVVSVVGGFLGAWLARRSLEPLRQLAAAVGDIGQRQFDVRVPVPAARELAELAQAVNEMAQRLERTTVSMEQAQAAQGEAERANNLKTRFLANLSHEIRTPLNAVVGHADLLKLELPRDDQEERLNGIQASATSLLGLIEDLLDLSKIETGNLTLKDAELDLGRLVDEAVGLATNLAAERDLHLQGSVDPVLPRTRRGDVDRLRQILVNLVINGLKYTAHGGVELQVSAGETDDVVIFEVRDTGPGIPAADRESLFQPFTRLSAVEGPAGAGLGLAICRELARAMGGELVLEGEVGRGTIARLEVTLPEVPVSEASGEPGPTDGPSPSSELACSGTVLVAEDNPVNLKVLVAMLRSLGVATEAADDGQAAVEAWQRRPYDLVLMDCSMPVVDGFDATRSIRRLEAGSGSRTPIVAVTAHAMVGDRERCLEAGMDDYLAKPVTLERLRQTLVRWLPAGMQP